MMRVTLILIQMYVIHGYEKYRFVKEENLELKDHVITTMTTPYVELCWDKCVWTMNCFSINVRNNRFGTFECDLNNSSKKASQGSLVETHGSQYHQMGEISGCDKYECKVKEKLADGWYRLDNSAIKIFVQNKTWIDARTHCQSLGNDLLSISTSYENEFVKDLFMKNISKVTRKKEDILPGLVKYWPLDGSDDDVNLKGDALTPRYQVIDEERALYFPGFRTYAEVPAVVLNPEGFTFLLWVKPANPSADSDTIYSDWYSPHTFKLTIHRPYKSIYFFLRGEGYGDQISTYYLSIAMDGWNHIAVSWNKTEKLIKIALNGTMKQETHSKMTSDIKRTSHAIYHLGIKSDELPKINGDRTFHGHMKHLMVFNKTLSIEEIQIAMHYNAEQGPWIGLNALDDDNTFKWSDGTNTQYSALHSYLPSPSFSAPKCIILGKYGKWMHRFCHESSSFICEKPFP